MKPQARVRLLENRVGRVERRAKKAEAKLAEVLEAIADRVPHGVLELIANTDPQPPTAEDLAWAKSSAAKG